MKLILIRHGQTKWNLKKRYLSFTDIDLNNKGIRQARLLRKRLYKEKIHRVYTSDKKRTLHFAKIVFSGVPIKKTHLLREINFGIFEGFTYKELTKKYPEIYRRWLKNPANTVVPEGEKIKDCKKRVSKIFRKIITLNGNKAVAVVCHGGTISIFINSFLKSEDIWGYIPKSASLSIIEYKNGKPKMKLFNDTSHLKYKNG